MKYFFLNLRSSGTKISHRCNLSMKFTHKNSAFYPDLMKPYPNAKPIKESGD